MSTTMQIEQKLNAALNANSGNPIQVQYITMKNKKKNGSQVTTYYNRCSN